MAAVLDRATPPSTGVIAGLLEKASRGLILDAEEMIALLAGTRETRCRRTLLEFARHYRRPHDREILLLPPLYFSSICENRCKYCSFSADGSRLSLEEFEREVDALIGMGYRSIELVSSQDPELYRKHAGFHPNRQRFRIPAVVQYITRLRERIDARGGGMITSNIPPVDVASLRRLRTAGLECFLCWLETMDPAQYRRLHDAEGPKSDQAFRLNAFERAVEAGIPHVAGAFLKGLHDWRREVFLFYRLDAYLKEKFGHGFSIIGTPRLKGAFMKSPLVRDYPVSDSDYELNLALDRILYDGILWQQTRESVMMNRHFIQRYGAGVILTLTCSTAPGGYSAPPRARAQFPVHQQNLAQEVRRFEDLGFRLHFKLEQRHVDPISAFDITAIIRCLRFRRVSETIVEDPDVAQDFFYTEANPDLCRRLFLRCLGLTEPVLEPDRLPHWKAHMDFLRDHGAPGGSPLGRLPTRLFGGFFYSPMTPVPASRVIEAERQAAMRAGVPQCLVPAVAATEDAAALVEAGFQPLPFTVASVCEIEAGVAPDLRRRLGPHRFREVLRAVRRASEAYEGVYVDAVELEQRESLWAAVVQLHARNIEQYRLPANLFQADVWADLLTGPWRSALRVAFQVDRRSGVPVQAMILLLSEATGDLYLLAQGIDHDRVPRSQNLYTASVYQHLCLAEARGMRRIHLGRGMHGVKSRLGANRFTLLNHWIHSTRPGWREEVERLGRLTLSALRLQDFPWPVAGAGNLGDPA